MKRLKKPALLLACLLLMAMDRPPEKITVYLIGDSTLADKRPEAFPETGWGMPFKTFFDASVTVDNRAKNGRSARPFIEENRWQPIVDQLKEGDYVFIQFGHNDEVKSKTDRYTPPEDFKRNLIRFITETRSRKATPVLLTPVSRRQFDDAGKVKLEPGEHPNYPDGRNDNTHFNELGARKMAQLVLKNIQALHLDLADRIVQRKKSTP